MPPAGTGQAVPLDHRVSHLARHAVGAVVDLTVVDDARAHTGTQRDGHKALAVPACAYIVFRQRRAVGVVLDIQRNGQVVVEQLPQRHVPQLQVAGIADGTGADLHRSGYADAHGGDLVQRYAGALGKLLRHGHDGPRQRLLIRDGRHLHFLYGEKLSVFVRQSRLQVCTADIYTHILHCFALFSFIIASILLSNCITKSRAAL